MTQILFFSLKEDLVPVLAQVESQGSLKYVLTGNFLKREMPEEITVFETGAELPNLGKATNESWVGCDSFLVCEQQTPINLRPIQGYDGERICIDQLINPDSVSFTPGGLWTEDVLLQGRIATASGSLASQALMKRFQAAIRKTFKKVQVVYYVGPKAMALLERGKRLTAAEQSPRKFDLVR